MQNIEAQQSICVYLVATQQQEVDLVAHQRDSGRKIGPNRDGPECQLVPGKQVAGVAEQEGHDQQQNADDPVELARLTVRTAIEDLEHVGEDEEDHQLRRPAMKVAKKKARRYDELQVLHVGVSLRHGRMVVE